METAICGSVDRHLTPYERMDECQGGILHSAASSGGQSASPYFALLKGLGFRAEGLGFSF